MATILEKPLQREIAVGKEAFIVTLSPEALKLTLKGRRNGLELAWKDIVSGDAALATALNASLERSLVRFRRKEGTRKNAPGKRAAPKKTARRTRGPAGAGSRRQ